MKCASLSQMIESAEKISRIPPALQNFLDRKKVALDILWAGLKGHHDLFGIYNTIVGGGVMPPVYALCSEYASAAKCLAALANHIVHVSRECEITKDAQVFCRIFGQDIGLLESICKEHGVYKALDATKSAVDEKADLLINNLMDECEAIKLRTDALDRTTLDGVEEAGQLAAYCREIVRTYEKLTDLRGNIFTKDIVAVSSVITELDKVPALYKPVAEERKKKINEMISRLDANLRSYGETWFGYLATYSQQANGLFKLVVDRKEMDSWQNDRGLSSDFSALDIRIRLNLNMLSSLFNPFAKTLKHAWRVQNSTFAKDLETLYFVFQTINSIPQYWPSRGTLEIDPVTGTLIHPITIPQLEWPDFLQKPFEVVQE